MSTYLTFRFGDIRKRFGLLFGRRLLAEAHGQLKALHAALFETVLESEMASKSPRTDSFQVVAGGRRGPWSVVQIVGKLNDDIHRPYQLPTSLLAQTFGALRCVRPRST